MHLDELELQVAKLSRAEKVHLLQLLARDIANSWPDVEKTAGVMGGDACVTRTRIPVWALENYRRMGWNEVQILDNYPTLRAADLINAWAYADAHPAEINQAILENEKA